MPLLKIPKILIVRAPLSWLPEQSREEPLGELSGGDIDEDRLSDIQPLGASDVSDHGLPPVS